MGEEKKNLLRFALNVRMLLWGPGVDEEGRERRARRDSE